MGFWLFLAHLEFVGGLRTVGVRDSNLDSHVDLRHKTKVKALSSEILVLAHGGPTKPVFLGRLWGLGLGLLYDDFPLVPEAPLVRIG